MNDFQKSMNWSTYYLNETARLLQPYEYEFEIIQGLQDKKSLYLDQKLGIDAYISLPNGEKYPIGFKATEYCDKYPATVTFRYARHNGSLTEYSKVLDAILYRKDCIANGVPYEEYLYPYLHLQAYHQGGQIIGVFISATSDLIMPTYRKELGYDLCTTQQDQNKFMAIQINKIDEAGILNTKFEFNTASTFENNIGGQI
jgi:hypothetical protein